MKAIYTTVNGKVYKINQSTKVPMTILRNASHCSSTVSINQAMKTATINVGINTLERPGTKSNKEKYNELVSYLKEKEITEIDNIQNRFKIYIDYSIFDEKKEIAHSIVIRPVEPVESAILLGVGTNNECIFRRVKLLNQDVEFQISSATPFGIMQERKCEFVLKVNNIAIYQDFCPLLDDVHESVYQTPYGLNSVTIASSLENMSMIYSTETAGIDISEMVLSFAPRTVTVSLNLILSNYIVVYNDATIDEIIQENIDAKYEETPDTDDNQTPSDGDESGVIVPDPENKPDADGDETPDKNGLYDYYSRCTPTNPNGLLVVEDLMKDSLYNPDTMVRKSNVVKDVPDIAVGDHVLYVEGLVTDI